MPIAAISPTVRCFDQRLVCLLQFVTIVWALLQETLLSLILNLFQVFNDVHTSGHLWKWVPIWKGSRGDDFLISHTESGLHWYLTYTDYHKSRLGVSQSHANPCLLFNWDGKRLSGMGFLQVKNSLICSLKTVLKDEKKNLKQWYQEQKVRWPKRQPHITKSRLLWKWRRTFHCTKGENLNIR